MLGKVCVCGGHSRVEEEMDLWGIRFYLTSRGQQGAGRS